MWGRNPAEVRGKAQHERQGSMATDQQARFLSDDEADIAARAATRLAAFLERELLELPPSHPTALRYQSALSSLQAVALVLLH